MKALPVCIYESKRIGNCSNNGISSRYKEILLLNPRGFIDVDMDNPPENLCEFVERNLFGEEANFIRPYKKAEGAGWMDGGCIIDSSDSRFPSRHPVRLHDRDESWEMYNMMFD